MAGAAYNLALIVGPKYYALEEAEAHFRLAESLNPLDTWFVTQGISDLRLEATPRSTVPVNRLTFKA